ncbi:hypothetical protein RJ641_010611 [Dillenia turbinata]|uniref:ATPase AAA-type core domain-containing protein n=1 Tax=Dillenia turbinata TaxID=194707 RepID=A0AAN8V6H6_9MAGN
MEYASVLCYAEVLEQELIHFTLSGLPNFIDGLRSSFGDERIIIFTTNHKDRIDPALMRPGGMGHAHSYGISFWTTIILALMDIIRSLERSKNYWWMLRSLL